MLKGILDKIRTICEKQPNVNTITNSLVPFNTSSDIDYSGVTIIPNSSVVNGDTITHSIYIYYIDRLTDTSNEEYIYSVAETTLVNIVNSINEELDTNSYTINYFKHKFLDNCAGAYCLLSIVTPISSCIIDYDL